MQENKLIENKTVWLSVIENNVIGNLPATQQEFVTAKFSKQICKFSDPDLETLVSTLVMKTLTESGVKDMGDGKVVTFLRETLFKDLKHSRFSRLTFEEVKLAFEKGVRQEYGIFMGVNIQTMHGWLRAYLNSKGRELAFKEFYRITGELEHGATDRNAKPNPEGIKKVLEVLKPFSEKAKPDYIKKAKPPIVPSERDLFITACFVEHFQIWKTKPAKDPVSGQPLNGRFIEHEGQIVDELEYAQIKLKTWNQEE